MISFILTGENFVRRQPGFLSWFLLSMKLFSVDILKHFRLDLVVISARNMEENTPPVFIHDMDGLTLSEDTNPGCLISHVQASILIKWLYNLAF